MLDVHPFSNGLAKRAVQTIKRGLKKIPGDLETQLLHFSARFPQPTSQSPAILLKGDCSDFLLTSSIQTYLQKPLRNIDG